MSEEYDKSEKKSEPEVCHPKPLPIEREVFRGVLSDSVSYRILSRGQIGAKEIGGIIALLKTQQEVLAETPPEKPQ